MDVSEVPDIPREPKRDHQCTDPVARSTCECNEAGREVRPAHGEIEPVVLPSLRPDRVVLCGSADDDPQEREREQKQEAPVHACVSSSRSTAPDKLGFGRKAIALLALIRSP